jgi:hypothetical protein
MEKQKEYYVNNKDFYIAMCEFKDSVKKAKETDAARPHISNYIGDCIMKIATRLSTKKNFRNYPFVEEMVGDGVENVLMYIDNFKPYYLDKDGNEKQGNPFSYCTTIINYAFLRRIAKEKKHLYTKYKMMDNSEFFVQKDELDSTAHTYRVEHTDYSQEYISGFIRDFETNKRREVRKRKEKQ